jgi:hypothetical protein
MNRITFGQEAYPDISVIDGQVENLKAKLEDFEDNAINRSPDVYPTEFD